MTMQGVNMYQTQITHSNGAKEDGQLQFDYYINPFMHLNLPDVYFVNPSRHNVIGQQKTYAELFPSSEPYQFNYVYDNDGFPTERLRSTEITSPGNILLPLKHYIATDLFVNRLSLEYVVV